jgi:glycosyltransferase involved in cell wall biosynthesis
MHQKRKIIYFVNVDSFFISHRLPLALEGINRGDIIYLITKNTGNFKFLESKGIKCFNVNITRGFSNPLKDFAVIISLIFLFKKLKPDIVHQVTLKPYLFGTIALKFINAPKLKIINAITGLGYLFINERQKIFKKLLFLIMRISLNDRKLNIRYIFQNSYDLQFFKSKIGININKHVIIKGSGVDENIFKRNILRDPEGTLNIMFVARLLKDKGIMEFIEAAKSMEKQYKSKVQFFIVGGTDPFNPAGIKEEELRKQLIPGYLTWQGHTDDVRAIYENCDIACLPSYREGFPKSLVEAMSMQCTIITTDTPGCNDCVIENKNGFLVPVKNSDLIVDKIIFFLNNRELLNKFGTFSREKMIKEMSLSIVVNDTFEFYK